jgi:hypothetical protein
VIENLNVAQQVRRFRSISGACRTWRARLRRRRRIVKEDDPGEGSDPEEESTTGVVTPDVEGLRVRSARCSSCSLLCMLVAARVRCCAAMKAKISGLCVTKIKLVMCNNLKGSRGHAKEVFIM